MNFLYSFLSLHDLYLELARCPNIAITLSIFHHENQMRSISGRMANHMRASNLKRTKDLDLSAKREPEQSCIQERNTRRHGPAENYGRTTVRKFSHLRRVT